MILAAIRALLLSNGTIVARVGQRVAVNRRPQGDALPAITLGHTGGAGRDHAHRGRTGLTAARVQVDIWAVDGSESGPAQVAELELAVVQTLAGYRGTAAGIAIGGIFAEGTRDLTEEQQGHAPVIDRRSIDFTVHYQEE